MNENEELFEISKEAIKNLDYHIWRKPTFENRYPILTSYIDSQYSNIGRWIERLYLYTYNLKEPPKCQREGCNNNRVFLSFKKGYQPYCGPICAGIDSREKTKQTNLKKFGVEWHQQTEESKKRIKQTKLEKHGDENYNNPEKTRQTKLEKHGDENYNNIERIKQTCLDRFGVDSYMKTEEFREKSKQTCLIKFGLEHYTQTEAYKEQFEQTCLDHFGVDHPMKNEEIKNESKINRLERLKTKYPFLIEKDERGNWICKCPHPECNKCEEKCYLTTSNIFHDREKHNTELCTNLYPYGEKKSSLEIIIHLFLEKNSISFQHNIWSLIKNEENNKLELDLYFPSQKLAIEINGEMYHNIDFKEEDYHIKKFQECQNKGIELVSIWGEWIVKDLELVKEFILDKLSNRPLHRYKRKWFPDLKDNEWPNDLGWYKNNSPSNIISHSCTHLGFSCSDSGITNLNRN